MSGPSDFITEKISQADVEVAFHCGIEELDKFFRENALPNERGGLGRTYVWRAPADAKDLPRVLGFYTISMAQVKGESLPTAPVPKLPNYPLPVALLGRFAIQEQLSGGKGYGPRLLGDALMRIVSVLGTIGCCGIITDAKNPRAVRFYEKHGFVAVKGQKLNQDGSPRFPLKMFLSMETLFNGIAAILPKEGA